MILKNKKERIYVDPEFKKFLLMKKIESGSSTLASFTAKAAKNPDLLTNKDKDFINKKYKKRGNYFEPLF